MEIRNWQEAEKKEFVKVLDSNPNKTWVSIDACVGSGKTIIPFFQIKEFIKKHPTERTFHFFVTPRIKLNEQQRKSFEKFCDMEHIAVKTLRWDCQADGELKINDKDNLFIDDQFQHFLVFIVDESLWGMQKDGDKNHSRLNFVISCLDAAEKRGCIGGVVAFDESHNYQNHAWEAGQFGKKKNGSDIERLSNHFSVITLMSGTPADYQLELNDYFGITNTESLATSVVQNGTAFVRASCPLYEAVSNKYVVEPTLYRVFARHDQLAYTIRRIFRNEEQECKVDNVKIAKNTKKKFVPRLVINMANIDECHVFDDGKTLSDHIQEWYDGHIVIIHSDKSKETEDGDIANMEPEVDGLRGKKLNEFLKENNCNNIIELLELVDEGKLWAEDSIILFQVDMISEGINLKSFTGTVVQSQSAKKQMQQIGRPIRNLVLEEDENGNPVVDKIRNGHASIYVVEENQGDVLELLCNLSQYGLTEDCFKWAKRSLLPVSSSTMLEEIENGPALSEGEFGWVELDQIPELQKILFNWKNRRECEKTIRQNVNMFDKKVFEDFQKLLEFGKVRYSKGENEEKIIETKKLQTKSQKSKMTLDQIKSMPEGVEKEKEKEIWYQNHIQQIISMRTEIMQYIFREGFEKEFWEEMREDHLLDLFDGKENVVNTWVRVTDLIPSIKEMVYVEGLNDEENQPRIK